MTRQVWMAGLLVLAFTSAGSAAGLSTIERRIGKEPTYATRSPRYALLVIGPEMKDRVWLVMDGDTLYVDRNGNGDLTDPAEKISAKKSGCEEGSSFVIDELKVAGKTHLNLNIDISPLKTYMFDVFAKRADLQAALKKDPNANILYLSLEVEAPHLKAKGRIQMIAGPIDLNGPLQMAEKPGDAPVIHCCGPLEVTFFANQPRLRKNRANEMILVVGTRGVGPGSFSMLCYDETIPKTAHPTAEILFPGPKPGAPPVKKLFELKERC
jgi:hypothetical protein